MLYALSESFAKSGQRPAVPKLQANRQNEDHAARPGSANCIARNVQKQRRRRTQMEGQAVSPIHTKATDGGSHPQLPSFLPRSRSRGASPLPSPTVPTPSPHHNRRRKEEGEKSWTAIGP